MITVLLIIHALIAATLIGVILIQRSEGGALGGLGGATGGFMTARGTANLLTRATAVLAGLFIVMSLVLAILFRSPDRGASIVDGIDDEPVATSQPIESPIVTEEAATEAAPAEQPTE
ncbi:MAG: preprotein translocase subunit SecG [Alphaproteobacteria bacterium]